MATLKSYKGRASTLLHRAKMNKHMQIWLKYKASVLSTHKKHTIQTKGSFLALTNALFSY